MTETITHKIIIILFSILSLIIIPLFSYHLTLNIYATNDNQQQTIDYVQSKNNNLQLNYTSTELSHLQDVKKVMTYMDLVYYISIILSLALVIYAFKQKILPNLLYYSGITLVSVIGIILLFILLFFNNAFILFHQIFFPQGNWEFPVESLLIQTFPLQFFINISIFIFVISIIIGIVFIVARKSIKAWTWPKK